MNINSRAPEGVSNILAAPEWAGARRLRRFAMACRWAGRHGAEFPPAVDRAVCDAIDPETAHARHRLNQVSAILEDAYAEGARERSRIAADEHLSHHRDSNPEAGDFIARAVVETVAWSPAFIMPDDIERVVLEAMEAAGFRLSASARRMVPVWAEMAFNEAPWAEPHFAPVEGATWPRAAGADLFGPKEASAPDLDPFAFDSLPGLLGDVARWSHGFAFKPVPEFAVASALVTMSALFGRRFTTPTGLGLNVYIVGIAPTGGGKEAALAAPQALLDEAGFSYLLGPGDFTSDTAIEIALRSRPCQAMFLDEFGQLLGAVQGRNAPSFARLARKALLEIFTKSGPGGRWTGKARASDDVDKAACPIYSPTLTLLACSTIDGFFSGLTEDNLGDGFVNRLTVVRAKAVGARNMDPSRAIIPERLVLALKDAWAASRIGEGNMPRSANDKPALRAVPWADDAAEAAWLAVAEWEDAEREKPGREGILGRAAEQVQKFATIAALARDPGAPAVTTDDVRWAEAFVRASVATLDDGVSQNMAGSEFEALVKNIERALRAAKYGGLPMSQLLRCKGVSKADPRMIDAALKRLEQLNIITREIGPTGTAGAARNSVILRDDF